ncbi:MAG: DUF1559 domain-containing protein [Pirellulaceae bacterium]|nr:DUF1559 domain-containing protein [Pirellulaceae bacterium]
MVANAANGIFYCASQIGVTDIEDGTTNTYLFGEKYLNPDSYTNGTDLGDNESMYVGENGDISRWSGPTYPPYQDRPGFVTWQSFGSAHPGSFNMVFCDGKVRSINYDVDSTLHGRLANRRDGSAVDATAY